MSYPAHINFDGNVQSCRDHCINVADMASEWLAPLQLQHTGFLAGILHDCGKFTDDFRDYMQKSARGESVTKGSVIHTFSAVRFLLEKYHESAPEMQVLAAEIMACAVGSHHGLFDCFDPDGNSGMEHRLKKQPAYDRTAIDHFLKECIPEDELDRRFGLAVTEIGGYTEKILKISQKEETHFYLSLLTRLITSAVIDADRRDTASFMNGAKGDSVPADRDLWRKCSETLKHHLDQFPDQTEIQHARKAFSSLCHDAADLPHGIYRLNLPTGAGKTLSGLRFALRHAELRGQQRIFLISPLLTILDQNADAVRKAIDNDSIILEHHSNVIADRDSETERDRYGYLTETWDVPIVITTMVQFLNTLFLGKTSSIRRFHALANSVIVIDEVQTVPGKMLTLFNLAMNFLSEICGSTVVLCSATQPEFGNIDHRLHIAERDIIPEQVLKKYEGVFKRNTVIDRGSLRIEEIPDFVKGLSASHQSVLAVCNKKSEAVSVYKALGDTDAKCMHLSASMCMAHRKEILSQIRSALARQEKVICISTQVIEAGVDISFDAVVRLSAGLDSIVQAAGRCNRNGENASDSPVYIVNCANENLTALKEIKSAKDATGNLLYAYQKDPARFDNDLSSAKAVSFFYQRLYGEMRQGYRDYTVGGYPSLYSLLSDNRSYYRPQNGNYLMRQAFKTAGSLFEVFDTGQQSVIVPYGEGASLIAELEACQNRQFAAHELKKLLDAVKPYCISVFEYQRRNLAKAGAMRELFGGQILVLDQAYYDKNTGLLQNAKEDDGICSTLIW